MKKKKTATTTKTTTMMSERETNYSKKRVNCNLLRFIFHSSQAVVCRFILSISYMKFFLPHDIVTADGRLRKNIYQGENHHIFLRFSFTRTQNKHELFFLTPARVAIFLCSFFLSRRLIFGWTGKEG